MFVEAKAKKVLSAGCFFWEFVVEYNSRKFLLAAEKRILFQRIAQNTKKEMSLWITNRNPEVTKQEYFISLICIVCCIFINSLMLMNLPCFFPMPILRKN